MGLAELVNGLLQNFYAYFAPPGGQCSDTDGSSFYESIIVPALQSPEFRARLLKEPEAVLKEFGIEIPEGMTLQFLENTDTTIHIVIPPYIGE
ncbi:MAG TPA: nitrile hydratase subunit alpha [Syntrophobacteraceae bacterium]|nr:nitrile hydratase subunit alpha [Syntrophobacteraceae bacterium]